MSTSLQQLALHMTRSTWVWCMVTKIHCTGRLLHTGKLTTTKIFMRRLLNMAVHNFSFVLASHLVMMIVDCGLDMSQNVLVTNHTVSISILADISHLVHMLHVCCHSNETCAPITNPSISTQLGGTVSHSPSYIRVCILV